MADDKPGSDLEKELGELRRRWLDKLPDRLREVDRLAEVLLAGSAASRLAQDVQFALHRLAGSGTSFGFPEVTRTARAAEYEAKRLAEQDKPLAPAEAERLGMLLEALRRAGAEAIAGGGV